MRIGIFSDVHGNLPALELVLDELERRGCDRLVCVGDLVDGGDQNTHVVERVRGGFIDTVMGNHDASPGCGLDPWAERWLRTLPYRLDIAGATFVHISPLQRPQIQGMRDRYQAWNVFDETDLGLVVVGHTHRPLLFGSLSARACEAREVPVDSAEHVTLAPDERYVVSFGAVGYPRGGGRWIRCGLLDLARRELEFIRIAGPLLPLGIAAP